MANDKIIRLEDLPFRIAPPSAPTRSRHNSISTRTPIPTTTLSETTPTDLQCSFWPTTSSDGLVPRHNSILTHTPITTPTQTTIVSNAIPIPGISLASTDNVTSAGLPRSFWPATTTNVKLPLAARGLFNWILFLRFILQRVVWYFAEGGVVLWRGLCGTLKRVAWYFDEGGVVLWRGLCGTSTWWCGTLKRVVCYFEDGCVVLWRGWILFRHFRKQIESSDRLTVRGRHS